MRRDVQCTCEGSHHANSAPSQAHWGTIPGDSVWDAVHEVNLGLVALTSNGLLSLSAGSAAGTSSWSAVQVTPPLPQTFPQQGRLVLTPAGALSAIVSPAAVRLLACSKGACVSKAVPAGFGEVSDAACIPASTSGCQSIWVAASTGLWEVDLSTGSVRRVTAAPQTAVAAAADGSQVFSGGQRFVSHWTPTPPKLVRREWVTNVTSGEGGVYDGVVTAMTMAPDGTLFVATPQALNVRYANRTVVRVAGLQGLVVGNLTSVAVGTAQEVDQRSAALAGGGGQSTWQLVLGSTQGSATVQLGGAPSSNPGTWTNWRFFNGPRYLPTLSAARGAVGNAVARVVAGQWSPGADQWVSSPLIVTTAGLSALAPQVWTLAKKAAAMEVIQARHNRHGMTSDCSLLEFGNFTSCTNHPSDNNGLWTSLVVAAEAMRWAVTKDPTAAEAALAYLQGMHLLVQVTGVNGLMARSAVSPGESTGPGGTWHNSTAPGLEGWQWKGDTSSDEVTGHTFAYPIAASLLGPLQMPSPAWAPGSPGGHADDVALTLLHTIVSYIAANNMTLVDVTGLPTRWGHWDPPTMNRNRVYSDGRGVNSLQALAFLQAGAVTAHPQAPFAKHLLGTYASLVHQHDYGGNVVNLKIESPVDDNYSDDELTFLPLYLFAACNAAAGPSALDATDVQAGFRRTFDFVRPWRSDLWGAIWLASGGAAWSAGAPSPLAAACAAVGGGDNATSTASAATSSSPLDDMAELGASSLRGRHAQPSGQTLSGEQQPVQDAAYTAAVAEDIAWNLRTWPLDLVDWPVDNSNRLDVFFRRSPNRFGRSNSDSVRVLPANERAQFRWNGNPHALSGGSGRNEYDAGAWLLPYWLARYHDILQ